MAAIAPDAADRPAAASLGAPRVDADGRLQHRRLRPRRARGRVRHAALRLRRGRAPAPVPGVRATLRRRHRGVRGQGVPVHGDGPRWSRRRGCTSTSPPAASCTSRCTPASPPSAWCSTATTSPTPSCAPRSTPASGGIVADSFDELDRLEALVGAGGPRRRVLVRVTPGSRSAHARVHRDRHRGSKFGFTVPTARARRGRAAGRRESDALDFGGFHCHIGSQIFVLDVVRGRRGDRRRTSRPRSRATTRRRPSTSSTSAAGSACAYLADDPTRSSIAEYAGVAARRRTRTACADAGLDPRAAR